MDKENKCQVNCPLDNNIMESKLCPGMKEGHGPHLDLVCPQCGLTYCIDKLSMFPFRTSNT